MSIGKIRWGILAWIVFITMVSYFDRVNFSVAAPLLMAQFGLNPTQLGFIMGAFTIGYAFLNFSGGFLVERYTPRRVLTAIILLWSVMTVVTGLAWSFASLMVIRIVFGMCEGPMAPASTRVFTVWMLPRERGIASGLALAAMPAGIIIGNLLSTGIVAAYGWRSVFFIFGAAGVLVAIFTWMIIRNQPGDHPAISRGELDLIQSTLTRYEGAASQAARGSTLGELLKNPWVWALCGIFFSMGLIIWANINWLPTYFMKARGSGLLRSGVYSSIPWVAAALGPLVLGWLSDHVGRNLRAPWLALSMFAVVPAVAFAVATPSVTTCLILFSIASFFVIGALAMIYVLPMEIFDRSDVAKVAGMMLAWGSLAGVIAPVLVGYVLQATNSFNVAYYIFSGVSFTGGCLSLALLGREKAVRDEKQPRSRSLPA